MSEIRPTRLVSASTACHGSAPVTEQGQSAGPRAARETLPSVPIPAAQQRVGASPSPATNVVSEDEGQRRVGGGESLLDPSDNAPAGTTHFTPSDVPTSRGGKCDAPAQPTKEEAQGAGTRVTLNAHIDVRVTRKEHAAITRRATALGVRPSTWARAVMRDALDERRHEVEALAAHASVPQPVPELARAVEQVRRVGVNLNQIVRCGAAVDEDVLNDVLAAVSEVRSLLGDEVSL